MKRKLIALALIAALAAAMTACSTAGTTPTQTPSAAPSQTQVTPTETPDDPQGNDAAAVDLHGHYTLHDPEGLDYDERYIIYMDEDSGNEIMEAYNVVANYMVFYGKDGAGKHMISIYVCKTPEDATKFFNDVLGQGTVDGCNIVAESGEELFLAMADFFPSLSGYVDEMYNAGYLPFE